MNILNTSYIRSSTIKLNKTQLRRLLYSLHQKRMHKKQKLTNTYQVQEKDTQDTSYFKDFSSIYKLQLTTQPNQRKTKSLFDCKTGKKL